MIALRASEAAAVVGGTLHGEDAAFRGLSTDTRALAGGELFVALRGPNFDGNEFLATAAAAGAAAAICERASDALPCIVVADARAALGRLASAWRGRFDVDVVGVTGSNGKTTVKEMVAAILARDAAVLATRGNLNNDIGVPLTVACLGPEHRRMVVEMGANHPGEIAALAAIARPRIGVITQIAPAHLEGFGSVEGVARAKGELIEALPADGVAVVNADDAYAELWCELARGRRMLRFGFGAAADVRATHAAHGDGSRVVLDTPHGRIDVELNLAGRHNAANAAAATAVALALDLSPRCIREGLEGMRAVRGRLEIKHAARGVRVLDDTYNANPESLRAALEVLHACASPRWLVLGDMAELGPNAPQFHRDAGRMARALDVEHLCTTGALARLAAESYGAGAEHFDSGAALAGALAERVPAGASVLIKGSRSMGMESVVDAIVEGDARCC